MGIKPIPFLPQDMERLRGNILRILSVTGILPLKIGHQLGKAGAIDSLIGLLNSVFCHACLSFVFGLLMLRLFFMIHGRGSFVKRSRAISRKRPKDFLPGGFHYINGRK
jgi:hypothetical protein